MFKKYTTVRVFTFLSFAFACQLGYAQNVGINSTGAAPAASAGLDVDFTNKGFLAPRMTAAQRGAIPTPATGLLVYQTDAPAGFYFYNGSAWVIFNSGAISGWSTTGNPSTTPGTHFIGTTDSKDFVFKTSNSERARILSSGNFGVGTTAPTEKLEVNGGALIGAASTAGEIKISNSMAAGATDIFTPDDVNFRITNHGSESTGASLQLKNSSLDYLFSFEGRGGFRYYSRNTGKEKFKVNDGGDIYLTTDDQNTAIDARGDINDFYQMNIMNENSGSNASTDIVATADNGDDDDAYIDMGINSSNYNVTTNGVANILNGQNVTYLYGNGQNMLIGNAARQKPLIFFTNSSSQDGGVDARGTERMRITATGEVCIGTDTPYESGSWPFTSYSKLTVNGSIRCSSLSQSSDRRLKTNIQTLNYGLKDVLSLQPVKYNWIDKTQSPDTQLGLIAQDAKKVIPEVVVGNEEKGMLGINYTELIPVLINAIKEQQAQIEELKLQVKKLQK